MFDKGNGWVAMTKELTDIYFKNVFLSFEF